MKGARLGWKGAFGDGLARLLPTRLFVRGPLRTPGSVYLTFDDGPHPVHTPHVLAALARCRAHATFFLVGERTLRHPNLARAIVEAGHAVGNHSFTHDVRATTDARRLHAEFDAAARAIAWATGVHPTLVRPPHGAITLHTAAVFASRRDHLALWSLDPKDYEARTATETIDRVCRAAPRAGEVVLLHDVNARAAAVTERVVHALRRRGLVARALRDPVSRP